MVGNFLTHSYRSRYYPPMRGRKRFLSGISLLVVLLPLMAFAQHRERKRAERAEIGRLEQEWRQAQVTGDIPEMDRLLAEDFLGITAAGRVVTKAQQLDRMRTRQIDLHRLDMSDTKMKISGNLAVVTSLAALDGIMDGHPIKGWFRYTRVYQRSPAAGWRITNFEATRVPGVVWPGSAKDLSPPAMSVSPTKLPATTVPGVAGPGPRAGVPNLLPAFQAGSGFPPPRS